MKFISAIIMCLIWTTSFSQLTWKPLSKSPAKAGPRVFDSTVSKKIVIMFTTNKNGKVITASYVRKESTSAEQQLIKNAKLIVLEAKPLIHMSGGTNSYYGSYTFVFAPNGELLSYFQNNVGVLVGTTVFVHKTLQR